MDFAEGDVEGGEGGIVGDCFGVDEESAIVLGFEGFIVVAICVGRVVEEDEAESPEEGMLLIRIIHKICLCYNLTPILLVYWVITRIPANILYSNKVQRVILYQLLHVTI